MYMTKHKEQRNSSAFDRKSSSDVRRQIIRKEEGSKEDRQGVDVKTNIYILSTSPAVVHSFLALSIAKLTELCWEMKQLSCAVHFA